MYPTLPEGKVSSGRKERKGRTSGLLAGEMEMVVWERRRWQCDEMAKQPLP
jgi:hypothetical protein